MTPSQSACKQTHVEKTTKSHPFQCILNKCQMTSMCSDGHKNYILFPIKNTQTTQNSKKITRQTKRKKKKKKPTHTPQNKKTTFSRKYFPILVNQMGR